jgi:predicted dehydrogenase
MKILFIGFGSIARKHKAALDSLFSGIEYFALRSGGKESSEEIEHVKSIYSIEEIPEVISFAIIASPTYKHSEGIRLMVLKRIPIFIEKPILNSLEEGDILNGLIKQHNIFSYVACNLRFLTSLRFLKSALIKEDMRINEVNIYAGSYLPDWRPHLNWRQNYSAHADMGGGVHLDLFHELDYAYWLFGAPLTSLNIKRSSSSLEISAIDFASYSMVYNDFVATITLNYFRRFPKRVIEIVFENDIWEIDILKNCITSFKNGIIFKDDQFRISDTYASQMKWFVECLESGKNNFNTFEDSLNILKICLKN